MNKKGEKKMVFLENLMAVIFISFAVIFGGTFCVLVYDAFWEQPQRIEMATEYCQDNNWEYVQEENLFEFRCYKKVESETGLGYDIVKSGKIIYKEIEEQGK